MLGGDLGHGNNPSPTQNYNTALTEAKTKSASEIALENAALKTLNWADKGDYTNPHEAGLILNYADPAMLHRNDELAHNAGAQGISALGPVDPNYLAAVRANTQAHEDETNAAQYEHDVQAGIGRAAGIAGDESKLDLSRKIGVLGTTADLKKSADAKPKWWEAVFSRAAGGLSAAAA